MGVHTYSVHACKCAYSVTPCANVSALTTLVAALTTLVAANLPTWLLLLLRLRRKEVRVALIKEPTNDGEPARKRPRRSALAENMAGKTWVDWDGKSLLSKDVLCLL